MLNGDAQRQAVDTRTKEGEDYWEEEEGEDGR